LKRNYLAVPVKWEQPRKFGAFNDLNQEEYRGKADKVNIDVNGISQTATAVRQFGQKEGTM